MFAAFKGWLGETGIQFGMWLKLDRQSYRRVHDLVIPCGGGTTQIDHVIVSVWGIFVIETKNMKGWIFGDEKSSQWTQSIFGKKYRFQNPLRQNYRHAKALTEFLGVAEACVHPVVVFAGDCQFKTPMPPNVLDRGLCRFIESFRQIVFTPGQVEAVWNRLTQAKVQPAASHRVHVAGLRERHHGNNCPKCGSVLVVRTARKGANAGGSFVGCSGYPGCRYTRSN
jgi:restriction system protein